MEYYTPFDIFPQSQFSSYENYVSYVSNLPKSIRSILAGTDGADFIRLNLQPAFKLDDGQILSISEVVRDILLGTLFIGDLALAISKEASVDPQIAKNISDTIVGQLFAPAINEIKQLQKENFSDRLGGGAGQSAPNQSQSSQTINLRSQASVPPKPAPVDPIIASLKTQQGPPRPTMPSQPQSASPQNRPPQTSPQPQSNPQKTQNVFKIPDIDFGSDQAPAQPKQDGQRNVLDLRDQK